MAAPQRRKPRPNQADIKKEILSFCKANTAEYMNVNIMNFTGSWNNGLGFCALTHHFQPEAFDFDSLNPDNRRENFQLAFEMAQEHGNIAPLLDVDECMSMPNLDGRCVFTYVQSFYRRFRDHPSNVYVSEL